MTQQGFISLLTLNAADCSWLEIKDTYSALSAACSAFMRGLTLKRIPG